MAESNATLTAKLTAAGLIEPVEEKPSVKLGKFLDGYIESRKNEVERRTIENLKVTRD